MKDNAEQKISKDAVEQMILFLETIGIDIISLSDMYSKHDKRKVINSKDINLAIKTILDGTYEGL